MAITRPKHFLFVIGCAHTLVKDEIWHTFVLNCMEKKQRGRSLITVKDTKFRADSVKHLLINQTDLKEIEDELD